MVSTVVEAWNEAMPFGATLGIEWLASAKNEVRGRLAHREELTTAGGILHGGAVMALADAAGAICAYLNLPDGANTVTIESKTNFLRAVRGGHVEAVARPVHVGRTIIFVETDVLDADGRLAARVTQTQAVV
jgi:1,4-dihydroxy-2-naphthoyl-CoA hydrolase